MGTMQFTPLPMVKSRIRLGAPLPFNIRNADGTLLLARGQLITNDEQLEALFERGALVDSEEILAPTDLVKRASIDKLPALWDHNITRVGSVLKASAQTEFAIALAESAAPVLALIDRDPDLAIFQVVRQGHQNKFQGISRSIHAAIAGHLAARRLGWDAESTLRAFKASLTMNLSVLELQSRLSNQTTPLTEGQRALIHGHPLESVKLLQEAGIQDAVWLTAVAQHHEDHDGRGYPHGATEISELAGLLRRADIYTAKLAARASRAAMPADTAAKTMFMSDKAHPVTASLVKEFGIYPPGTHVRLVSGELGVVVKRGEQVNAPIVAALTNRSGDALSEPVRRNCADKAHAIAAVVPESALKVRVSPEKLVVLAAS